MRRGRVHRVFDDGAGDWRDDRRRGERGAGGAAAGGARAKIFYWLSGAFYEKDSNLTALETGLFDGIKLHELEGHWVKKRPSASHRVLRIAQERGLPVQFHSGPNEFCSPRVLAKFAQEFPSVRFDFAHCCPMDEMAAVVAACPNVWTDTAFMDASELRELPRYDWHGRLMFGSDLPVWQAHEDSPLTPCLRSLLAAFRATGLERASDLAFARFLGEPCSISMNAPDCHLHHSRRF